MKDKTIFWLLTIFIVYMNFEGYFKLKYNYHPIAQGFKYIFAFAFFLVWILSVGIQKTNFNTPLFVFSAFVFIQFLNPLMWQGRGLTLSFIGMLYYIAFVPLFFIGYKLLDLEKLKKILFLILILASISAIFAHIQFVTYHSKGDVLGFYKEIMKYPEESMGRIQAFSFHGPLAFDVKPPRYWYSTGILLSILFLLTSQKRKIIYSFLGINLLFVIVIAGYRFAMIATLIALVIMFFFNLNLIKTKFKIKNVLFVFLLLSTILIIFSPKLITEFNQSRFLALSNPIKEYFGQRGWTLQTIIHVIRSFPLGGGLRGGAHIDETSYGIEKIPWVGAGDNYLLIIISEIGILALISLFWIYFSIKNRFIKNHHDLDGFKNVANVTLFAILVTFIFEVGFLPGEGPSYWMFWLFSGALFRLGQTKLKNSRIQDNVEASFLTKKIFDLKNYFDRKINKHKKNSILFNSYFKSKEHYKKWLNIGYLPKLYLKLKTDYDKWRKKDYSKFKKESITLNGMNKSKILNFIKNKFR